MKRFIQSLIHRKRDRKAVRIYVGAQALCAVVLGARIQRLTVGRFGGGGACEIDGFDSLPLFSQLIIWSAGRATTAKTGLTADDSLHLDRASGLAASIAPSRREVQKLLRLAREEAERIVRQRWPTILRIEDALAERGELEHDRIARIVLQPTRPKKTRPPRVAARPRSAAGKSRPRPGAIEVVWARWTSALVTAVGRVRTNLTTRAVLSAAARAPTDGQMGKPAATSTAEA
jgi:hypothetical protein